MHVGSGGGAGKLTGVGNMDVEPVCDASEDTHENQADARTGAGMRRRAWRAVG